MNKFIRTFSLTAVLIALPRLAWTQEEFAIPATPLLDQLRRDAIVPAKSDAKNDGVSDALKKELALAKQQFLQPKAKETTQPSVVYKEANPIAIFSPLRIGLLLEFEMVCGAKAELFLHSPNNFCLHQHHRNRLIKQSISVRSRPNPGWQPMTYLSDGKNAVYMSPDGLNFQIVQN